MPRSKVMQLKIVKSQTEDLYIRFPQITPFQEGGREGGRERERERERGQKQRVKQNVSPPPRGYVMTLTHIKVLYWNLNNCLALKTKLVSSRGPFQLSSRLVLLWRCQCRSVS